MSSRAVRWGLALRERPRLLCALLLALCSSSLFLVAQKEQGVARDEVFYMRHGSRYADWWIDLATVEPGMTREDVITSHFGGTSPTANNREHPPLMKTLFGLSERLFHDKLGWASEITAYRLPTVMVSALLVVLVFLFASRLWGPAEGLMAALLVFLLPRAFFHAGLATFDSAVVTFWFAALMSYHRAWSTRFGFVGFGLCVGLCLATKHNAIMLPAVFLPHMAWVLWRRRGKAPEEVFWRRCGLHMLVGLFVIAPLTALALWPWLWFDTVDHVREWIGFHLHHTHYNYEYLGENWNAPPFPWHVPLVTTLLVVPAVTLLAGALGVGVLVRRFQQNAGDGLGTAPGLLLLLSAAVAMGPFFLRTTPIFGAEKHWAAAMPSLCIAAAIGLVWAASQATAFFIRWKTKWNRRAVALSVWGLVVGGALAAAAAETARAQPHALTYYNALAGGPAGGADLGMNRQFWGTSARGVLPYLNELAPAPGAPAKPVYSHDASLAWGLYRKAGLLAKGLPDAGREERGIARSQIALVIHELHFNRHDYLIWESYGTVKPAYVLTVGGVPVVSVYLRPQ